MSKEITFETELLSVDKPGKYSGEFRVTADVDGGALLALFTAKEVAEHVDHDSLLDEIGEDYARHYFGIEPDSTPF